MSIARTFDIRDGLTLFGAAEADGYALAGSSGAVGRYFAVVPRNGGIDIEFGGFRTVTAGVGVDAGVAVSIGAVTGTPTNDLAGLGLTAEVDVSIFSGELSATDTGRFVGQVALSTPAPTAVNGSFGRTVTTLTSRHSVRDMAAQAFDNAVAAIGNLFPSQRRPDPWQR